METSNGDVEVDCIHDTVTLKLYPYTVCGLLYNSAVRRVNRMKLVWLYEYEDRYQYPFWFRQPIELPAGTVIRGVPKDAELILIPGRKTRK
jgi:hypothetical protein